MTELENVDDCPVSLLQDLEIYLDSACELLNISSLIEELGLGQDDIEARFAREAARLFPGRPQENHQKAAELVHRKIHEREPDELSLADKPTELRESRERWSAELKQELLALTGDQADFWIYSEVWGRVASSNWGADVLLSSLLMAAVADFEVFISRLFHAILKMRPKILWGSDRKFSYRELECFADLATAKQSFADDFVDGLLRGGFGEWTRWLLRQGVDLAGVTRDTSEALIETFQRRHLMVHNGGYVNKSYLDKVPSSRAPLGLRLRVRRPYLNQTVDRLSVVALKLTVATWLKLQKSPEEHLHIIRHANQYSYGLLLQRRDVAVKEFGRWICETDKGDSSERLMNKVNVWVARKRLGEDIEEEVKNWDTATLNETYRMVQLTLLGESDKAYTLVKKLVESGEIALDEWQAWPVLEPLRVYEAGLPVARGRIDPSGFTREHA